MTSRWLTHSASLPIAKHLDTIRAGIGSHSLSLLEAPPGTGKTTILPLALLDQPWLAGRSIIVLQPRRLAARSVATRMAELLGETVGETVGYSVRLESKRSKRTRIEVITEGLLTRRLIADPELSGVGLIIFDEFHERSIHADLSLALTLESQTVLRPDLKILIMSATLGESLPARFTEGAWRYSFEGTPHPVSIRYEPGESRLPIWERVGSSIRSALANYPGDILAFLPGAFEIHRTREILEKGTTPIVITPLFGDLPYSEQTRAITPDPSGRRKVVLSTTIAETSLTIEGVRVVIDSGLHRVSRIDGTGTQSLVTEPITRDAADQRAGRAGRTAAGVCIRLWSEQDHKSRRPYREPEILRSDLVPCILDLSAWGISSHSDFSWITPPPVVPLNAARRSLMALGAITEGGGITPYGTALAKLGAHPNLGAIALTSRKLGLESIAATLIALLEERDLFAGRSPTASILNRINALSDKKGQPDGARRVAELRSRWLDRIASLPKDIGSSAKKIAEDDAVAMLIALAYPERIARRREHSSARYLCASGRGASLLDSDPLKQAELLAVCVLHDSDGDMVIRLAAPLRVELFKEELRHLVKEERTLEISESTGALNCHIQMKVGNITLSSRLDERPSKEDMAVACATWLTGPGFSKVPFNERSLQFLARLEWASKMTGGKSLPSLSQESLRDSIRTWLIPKLPHPPTIRALTEGVVCQALESILSWQQRRELEEIAPPTVSLPRGKTRPIIYTSNTPPIIEVRIQDLFGVPSTPQIGSCKVPASIHLLSPAHRPVQVTSDLSSFWKNGYPQVRKELRGRYPKHRWPENPLEESD